MSNDKGGTVVVKNNAESLVSKAVPGLVTLVVVAALGIGAGVVCGTRSQAHRLARIAATVCHLGRRAGKCEGEKRLPTRLIAEQLTKVLKNTRTILSSLGDQSPISYAQQCVPRPLLRSERISPASVR